MPDSNNKLSSEFIHMKLPVVRKQEWEQTVFPTLASYYNVYLEGKDKKEVNACEMKRIKVGSVVNWGMRFVCTEIDHELFVANFTEGN
jgi:hypothetical protein